MSKKNKMDRREALKTLSLGTLAASFVMTGCETPSPADSSAQRFWSHVTQEDLEKWENRFFTDHEFETVRQLANMIIPADDRSGNAEEAGVPEFIDFMMLDRPDYQTPVRGGLRWLDTQCQKMFGSRFVDCSDEEKHTLLDEIAWPDVASAEMRQGVSFFNRFRDLVASGFWSSRIGIEDIGYVGNQAHNWQGCPDNVLEHIGIDPNEI